MTTRRGFMASILAAGFAPAAAGSGILMPIRSIQPWEPDPEWRPQFLASVHYAKFGNPALVASGNILEVTWSGERHQFRLHQTGSVSAIARHSDGRVFLPEMPNASLYKPPGPGQAVCS